MATEQSISIGERIRRARREKGMSVESLAAEAGCSDEFLQWVEAGQVEPPVALLIRLARVLKLDGGTFLQATDASDRRLEEAAKRTEHYSYRTLTPPDPESHLMAFAVTIPPGTSHTGVGYRHEGEEFVYVLSGEVDLTVEQTITRLRSGQSLRFNSNLDHHLSNPGDKEVKLLVILYLP